MRWQLLSSRTVLRDRWIDLRADRCRTADGVEIDPYYVLSYPDWVQVVAVTAGRALVLVRQYRHGAGFEVLELPAGTVDLATDADPAEAARRELEEETGYRSDRWLHVSSLFPNPANQTNRLHIFLALDASPHGSPRLDPGEHGLEVTTLPLDEMLERIDDGVLAQATHVASLLLAVRLLDRLAS